MARIGKTGNAKIARKALERAKKSVKKLTAKNFKSKCRAAYGAVTEAAAHTGAAVHGNEAVKGLHKALHAAERQVVKACLSSLKAPPKRRKRSRSSDDDLEKLFRGHRAAAPRSRAASWWSETPSARFYAPASGSNEPAVTAAEWGSMSGLRRRRK